MKIHISSEIYLFYTVFNILKIGLTNYLSIASIYERIFIIVSADY